MDPIETKKVQMSMERVDEEGGSAQCMSVKSIFPCFSCRSQSLHSKCLSLTCKEFGELNIGTKKCLSGAGNGAVLSEWSDQEHSWMTGEEEK